VAVGERERTEVEVGNSVEVRCCRRCVAQHARVDRRHGPTVIVNGCGSDCCRRAPPTVTANELAR
jgi:hypothetical protein